MDQKTFIHKLEERGLFLSERQINQLDTYASYLKEYNEKINLTAIVEYEEILEKHFYDSLLLSFHTTMKGTLVDVGTGAGFPGVVIKICYPDVKVVLLEPLKKRCVFLESLIEKLGLEGIEVVNERGEDHAMKHREAYDMVTARAVTNLSALVEIAGAMVKVDGYFIALRGSSGLEEMDDARKAIQEMGFVKEVVHEEELEDGARRILGYLRKVKKTAAKYPRNYSMIKKKPL